MSKLKSPRFFWPLIIVLVLAALLLHSLFTGTESCLLDFNFFDIGGCILYWEDVIIIALIGFIAYLTISRVLIWIFSPAQKWVGVAFNGLAILAVLGSAYFWGMPLATLYRKFVTVLQTQSDQSKCNQAMKQTGFANDTIQMQNFRAEPVSDSQGKIQAFDLKFSLTSNFAATITIFPEMYSPPYSFGDALDFGYWQLPSPVVQVSPGKEVTVAVRVSRRSNSRELPFTPEILYGQFEIDLSSTDSHYNFSFMFIGPSPNGPLLKSSDLEPNCTFTPDSEFPENYHYQFFHRIINTELQTAPIYPSQLSAQGPEIMPVIPTPAIEYSH